MVGATKFTYFFIWIVHVGLVAAASNLSYRTGRLKTWFSSPSNNTIIHRVEQDLSNTGNILFNTIAGENAGELRTTSGGNNSEMIMTLANFTRHNSTPPQWYYEYRNPRDDANSSTPLMLVYDFRQISVSEMIIDIGNYVARPFFNGFEYKIIRRGCLIHFNRNTYEVRLLGTCDADNRNMIDDFLIDSVETQFLYKLQDDVLWIMNLNNITDDFRYFRNFTSQYLWRPTDPSFLTQHGNYLYVCRLDGVTQNYQITKISKPSLDYEVDSVYISRQRLLQTQLHHLDIQVPGIGQGLTSFVSLEESVFMLTGANQLLIWLDGRWKGICKGALPYYQEGPLDLCSTWKPSSLEVLPNNKVMVVFSYQIAELKWDSMPSTQETSKEWDSMAMVSWLLPLVLSLAAIAVTATLIIIGRRKRWCIKAANSQIIAETNSAHKSRDLPNTPDTETPIDENGMTYEELSPPAEEVYDMIGDEYYEIPGEPMCYMDNNATQYDIMATQRCGFNGTQHGINSTHYDISNATQVGICNKLYDDTNTTKDGIDTTLNVNAVTPVVEVATLTDDYLQPISVLHQPIHDTHIDIVCDDIT